MAALPGGLELYSYGAPLRKQESGACHSFLSLGGRHGSFLSLICTFSADGKGSYKVTKLHNFRFIGYKVIVETYQVTKLQCCTMLSYKVMSSSYVPGAETTNLSRDECMASADVCTCTRVAVPDCNSAVCAQRLGAAKRLPF